MIKALLNAKLNKDYEKIIIARINKMAEERTPIAHNPNTHFRIYLQATTLNGFNFLAFSLIGPQEIKTMNGCTLTFKSANDKFVLKSESDIIASDHSLNSNIGITLVDTDFEEDFNTFVQENDITEIKLDCKVGQIFKKTINVSYSLVNMQAFKDSMIPKEAEASGEISAPGAGSGIGF